MLQPHRNTGEMLSGGYRYGFNGMEKDDEVKGVGNSYTTEFRQYDPRIGRWLSIDPKWNCGESPYASMSNNPLFYTDPFGDTIKYVGTKWNNFEAKTKIFILRHFGPKGIRNRIEAIQNSPEIVIIKVGPKGSYNKTTNTIQLPTNRKYYKGLQAGAKSPYHFVSRSRLGTLANELSHAEDDLMGNAVPGNTAVNWPDGSVENIPNEEVESNNVENEVRNHFLLPERSNSHYYVAGSENWSAMERFEFRHILRVYNRDPTKGAALIKKYDANPNKSADVKKQLKVWT